MRRQADTGALFAHLLAQHEVDGGNEFEFGGDPSALWDMVSTFVDEEALCCPFFTFRQEETEDGVVLRISIGEA